jgi:hypothetical protein
MWSRAETTTGRVRFPLPRVRSGSRGTRRGCRHPQRLDLRVLKYFNIKPHGKLDLVVEAFNLLNRTNVSQINAVYGPLLTPRPAFGRPIEAGMARQIQFSVDFEF